MPSDYRLKYLAGQIADSNNNIDTVAISDETPDVINNNILSASGLYYETFEGGIHVNNARAIFLSFAAVIMILYVLES